MTGDQHPPVARVVAVSLDCADPRQLADFYSDIDAAARRAVALGASEPEQPDPRWRVLLDPAGHPFCLTPFVPEGTPSVDR